MAGVQAVRVPGPGSGPDAQNWIEPYPLRVRVVFNDVTVADSTGTLILRETGYPPVYYFPPADVRVDLLEATEHHTYCPFRGNAVYWTLRVGDRAAENGAWSYLEPFADAREIGGYYAFAPDEMDAWYEEEQRALVPGPDADEMARNPMIRWLVQDAPGATTTRELVRQLIECLTAADMPVSRLWLAIRTMHPQLFSVSYRWEEGGTGVEKQLASHDVVQSPEYLNSPLVSIFEGAGGVRRRLDVPEPLLDYPVVREAHADGATDYVVMPLLFSDGQINAISLATRQPGGFTTGNLSRLYEILPLLSRLLENHALRRNAVSLLETYLGKYSGQRVLDGQIKRGDAETIDAVIWFCDLRDSTSLADSMSRDEFLGLLNRFYDCVAQPILENGGEILRFIGDAALAIFPIGTVGGEEAPAPATAYTRALAAALAARAAVEEENRHRAERKEPPFEFGIALHVGDLTYGNIGTADRLEFTVIGAAANEAARIESMCKVLGQSILVSGDFVSHCVEAFVPLGLHQLRGVNRPQALFAPP